MKHWTVVLIIALTACPNEGAHPNRATQDNDAGHVEDPFVSAPSFDDERVRATDPTTLGGLSEPCRPPTLVLVNRVVDGDTIDVRGGARGQERIRLIGVDTPELDHRGKADECFAREATEFTERLRGHRVWLTFDRECRDRYGRVLAYVHTGPRSSDLWERQLLRRGFARALVIPPNDHFAARLRVDEQTARKDGVGGWARCPKVRPFDITQK